jgi:hypothetical protein
MSFLTGTQAELLYAMPATGGSVTGTVSTGGTAQLLTPANGATTPAFLLPAYFFPDTYGVSRSLLIQGGGTLLNGATTQNVRFALYLDTTAGTQITSSPGGLLCSTGLFSPFGTTVSTTGAFMFEVLVTATSVGTNATLNTVGKLVTSAAGNPTTTMNTTGPSLLMQSATQPTFNSSTAYFIDMFCYFGATTTTQACTLTNFYVWGLN